MASFDEELKMLGSIGAFDADWYARHYGDVPKGIDPAEHFIRIGMRLGRSPNPDFAADPGAAETEANQRERLFAAVFGTQQRHAAPEGTPFTGGLVGQAYYRSGAVRGWLTDPESRLPQTIVVTLGGRTVWSGEARLLLRVKLQGMDTILACGFRVALPPSFLGSEPQELEVRHASGALVPGGLARVTQLDRFHAAVRTIRVAHAGAVEISGHCIDYAQPIRPLSVEVLDALDNVVGACAATERLPSAPDAGLTWPQGAFRTEVKIKNLSWPLKLRCVELNACFTDNITCPEEADQPKLLIAGEDAEVNGRIEEVSSNCIRGWARSTNMSDRQVFLDLYIDGRRVSTTAARRYRKDLEVYFGDHGCHEFRFDLTPGQVWQLPGLVEVRPRRARGQILKRAEADASPLTHSKTSMISAQLKVFEPYLYRGRPRAARQGKISVIALNLDGAHLLERFFESFREHALGLDMEFLIVDHGSLDESAGVCERWSSVFDIKFLDRKRNYSFSESNNYAAKAARGDYLVFINNDVRLCEDSLAEFVGYLDEPNIGAVGACLLDDVPAKQAEVVDPPIQHLGVHFGLAPGSTVLAAYESRYSPDWLGAEHAPVRTPVVTGALMALKPDVFARVGGFHTGYFYGQEDVDLCLKLKAEGLEVVNVNNVKALHLRAYSRDLMDESFNDIRVNNRPLLDARFGFMIRRLIAEERFSKPGFWTGRRLRFAFIVTENSIETMAGDLFTAIELGEALSKQFGVDCVFIEHKSKDIQAKLVGVDVMIAMRDDFDPGKLKWFEPNMLKVAWVRNWFERFSDRPFVESYDEIWASSPSGAEIISNATGRRVEVLPIATNPSRFANGKHDSALASDYCFTGSFWGLNREIIQNLDPSGLPFKGRIFGQGWEQVPHLAGIAYGSIPYPRLADVYASSRLVIDDANHVTKQSGSVNSRVFDALAAGCLVVTNGAAGGDELFDGLLPTYDSPQELEALLFAYLGDERRRRAKVEQLQRIIFERHTYAHRAETSWARLKTASQKIRIAIKIGAPNRQVLQEWGDYHFARSLQREMIELGFHVRIDPISEWDNLSSNADDVVLVMRGLSAYKPKSHQINLMWMISHPDKTSEAELLEYDHVFVASEPYCARLKPLLDDRVSTLLQCTDSKYFNPQVQPAKEPSDLLFVGNSRKIYRRIVKDSIEAGLEPDIYGTRWSGLVPDHLIKGENIDNRVLASHYRAANVVLNDHWETMRSRGFISNRVFDVLACGGRLVSDPVEGMEELFGDAVLTYDTLAELEAAVEQLRESSAHDRDKRDAIGERILEKHSFAARAKEVSRKLEQLASANRQRIN